MGNCKEVKKLNDELFELRDKIFYLETVSSKLRAALQDIGVNIGFGPISGCIGENTCLRKNGLLDRLIKENKLFYRKEESVPSGWFVGEELDGKKQE
jgi:hypothetical protein